MRLRAALIVVCLIILGVYTPALHGPFVFDDFPSIVNNETVAQSEFSLSGLAAAAWSGDAGPLKRPLAYATFSINSMIAGGTSDTLAFKLTNVLIHLLNTVLVYVLARRLLRPVATTRGNSTRHSHEWMAVFAAAMWGLHPLQSSAVLHVVQRMTSLSAGFVLLGTIVFLNGRDLLLTRAGKAWILMWSGLGIGLLGLSAKENAAITPFLLFVLECTLYSRQQYDPRTRIQIRWFYLSVCGIPALLAGGLLLSHPDTILATYAGRDFNMFERLLTEARALWFYLTLLAVPDLSKLTVFHDDFPLSTGIIDPWTTLPAVIGVVLLFTIGILTRRRAPLLSLAILWFLVAHTIESTLVGLELVHEHRNYLPDIVLFIALLHGVNHITRSGKTPLLICLVLTLAYAGITLLHAHNWRREDTLIESMARHHPDSARSRAIMGEFLAYRRHALNDALPHYRAAMRLAPTDTVFTIQMMLAAARLSGTAINQTLPDMIELSDRVSYQLATQNQSGPIFDALHATVNCVVDSPNRCQDLYSHAVRWCDALLKNPGITSDARFFSADHALRLTLWKKDYQSALRMITLARDAEQRNSYYILMEADIYLRLGESDNAERALSLLNGSNKTRQLQEKITQMRSTIGAASERVQQKKQTGSP